MVSASDANCPAAVLTVAAYSVISALSIPYATLVASILR